MRRIIVFGIAFIVVLISAGCGNKKTTREKTPTESVSPSVGVLSVSPTEAVTIEVSPTEAVTMEVTPTPVFDSIRYAFENKETFAENAKALLSELQEEYNRNPGKDGSHLAVKSNLLMDLEMDGLSKLYVYEDAVYGMYPPESGEGTMFGYEVSSYLLTLDEAEKYELLYRYTESTGELSDTEYSQFKFVHAFPGHYVFESDPRFSVTMDPNIRVSDLKEGFFCAEIGRGQYGTYSSDNEQNYRYDAEYYLFKSYFSPDGDRIFDEYDTWGDETDYKACMGAFFVSSDGTVFFEQRNNDSPWIFDWYVDGQKIDMNGLNLEAGEIRTISEKIINDKLKLKCVILRWDYYFSLTVHLTELFGDEEIETRLFEHRKYRE